MSEHPKVFISYSHQNVEYENKILEFANRLRSEGIDANIDLYEEAPGFLAVLYSFPINPSLSRKHRKAYLPLSVSVGFDDTLFASLAISHSLEINCV